MFRRRARSLLRALAAASSGSMAVVQTLLARVLTLAVNLATGVLTARFLGPAGRADQAAILLGIGLFPSLVSFGVPVAVQYRIRSDPKNEAQLVSVATALAMLLGLLAAAAGYFVLPHVIDKYSASVLLAARIAMLLAPLQLLFFVLFAILRARHRFTEANVTTPAMPLLTLAGLVVLAATHRLTPVTSAAVCLMPYFWATPWLFAKVAPRPRILGLQRTALSLLSYGTRSYVTEILWVLSAQVDQVLVISLLSPVSMGIYVVALSAARVADLFSESVVAVLFPHASALDHDEAVALTARATRITAALLLLSTLSLIAAMPIVLPFFYGKQFFASVPVAQLIAVSFALNGVVYVLGQAYMANGRPGVIATIQLFGLATVVPAMLVLIPRFGLMGAALALNISTAVRLLLTLGGFPVVLKAMPPGLLLTMNDISYLREALGEQMLGNPR